MRADESDVRLHGRLVGGDDALAEAYDAWSALVYSIAMRITNDHTGAEDITQEVFLHLWEKPEAYDPQGGALRTWLCVTARSRALDWTRRTVNRRRYQTAAATHASVAAPDVDESLMWQTEATAVREAVLALPEPLPNAIRLAFYHQRTYRDRTYRDVARDLAIPKGTAKSRLRRGLATLADRLAAEGIIDK
jgi:RNA polymerase sigma factor (sigma-70 family)